MTPKNVRVVILTLCLALLGATHAFAQGLPIYNSIPNPLPGNLSSQPLEAQQAAEFGDHIAFSPGSGRSLKTVVQTMSSWGCESGHWYSNDCVTSPGATFSHPITLKIYAVGNGSAPGALLGSVTQTFAIPYRPSADHVNCTGLNAGKWYDGTTCFNGFATNITFNTSSFNFTLPNQVIYSISYNTSHYGYAPLGDAQPCSTSPGSCGYDSLNIAVADPALPSVGSNPNPNDVYFNTLTAGWYCDGGAGGTGTFRRDGDCWAGYQPSVRFNAANTPSSANDCKNGGWQTRTSASGQPFPNQGQCIQNVNTGK